MSFFNDSAKDDTFDLVSGSSRRLDICAGTEPTTYTEATSTYTCGNKTGITVPAPSDGAVSGRRVVVPAVTDGAVTATATAAWYALTDPANSRLLAVKALSSTQGVTNGNVWTSPAFSITVPDPA